MACTRNRSRILGSWLFLVSGVAYLFSANLAEARFAIKLSPTIGELYTDNIFYTKDKEGDFVTTITPTLSVLYAPEGQIASTLNLDIWSSGLIFARHSELNNFGDNWGLNGGYTYQYSPQLSFSVSDVLGRQGPYRLGAQGPESFIQGAFRLPSPPTSPPPTGGTLSGQGSQNLSNFTSGGSQFWNNILLQGSYRYRPDVSFTAAYKNNFVDYINQGASDLTQTIAFRGIYNWRQEHNLHAGVNVEIYDNRNSVDNHNVVVNFSLGDDYFSNFQINLSPTLTLTASSGISLNAGNNGPPVANNTNVTLTKIWETATLSGGVQHSLTSSYGVAGISKTTGVYGQFSYQVAEKLSTQAAVNFAFYDTDDGNFQTFQASAGARYQFTPWLASNLFYAYRWTDTSSQLARSELARSLTQAGVVRANAVYLTLTANFDLWPNIGLSRSITALTPLVTTPFPQATVPTTTPVSPTAPTTKPPP